jgi:hypothetical protein
MRGMAQAAAINILNIFLFMGKYVGTVYITILSIQLTL